MSEPVKPSTQVATTAGVTPGALVVRYRRSFTSLLPSHLREDGGDMWIAGVEALLRTRPEIAQAAANDTGAFLAALVPAAQKGLTPGTEEYYLVPFAPKVGQPRIIQGIVGYQGIVELIYRAGAVSSVIVEIVKEGDRFSYRPGVDERPQHEVDWFGGNRGQLIGAYAYATMRDGATSKVVVIGPDEIARAKAKSASAGSKYSPWTTNPEAMWMKTAARQLGKWVPTSAEYRRQQLRDAQAVMDERLRSSGIAEQIADLPINVEVADGEYVDPVTGEVVPVDDIVDADVVDPEPEQAPPVSAPMSGGVAGEATAGGATPPPPTPQPHPDEAEIVNTPARILTRQTAAIRAEASRLGIQADIAEKLHYLGMVVDRTLDQVADLTRQEAEQVIDLLVSMPTREALEAWAAGQETIA